VISRRELRAAASLYLRFFHLPNPVVIDVGAGNGAFWNVAPLPQKLFLVDYNPPAPAPDRRSLIADAALLPFRSGTVDGVIALGLIEYLPDLESSLREWHRVSKDSGALLASYSHLGIANRVRSILDKSVRLHRDRAIELALLHTHWKILHESRIDAGLQRLFIAQAI